MGSESQSIQIGGGLREVQTLLYRRITSSPGEPAGEFDRPSPKIGTIIRSDGRMGACERLQIYRDAYFYRLLDCLKEDYAATLAVLGAEGFQRMIADYLQEFPPTQPSIFYAGEHLADFIAEHSLARESPFIEGLARLERTTIEVFHGPDAAALDGETMRSIPPERWSAFELRIHPAVRFLDVNWKVSEVLRAVNERRQWGVPPREHSRMIVFRQESEVCFRELEAGEKRALDRAREPVTFAEVCELIAAEIEANEPASEINHLFQRWISDGILVAGGT